MLKYLALLFMLIDHLAFYLYPLFPPAWYEPMRQIGRLAFPIFAYLVAVNMRRTRNLPRYFLRLVIAAAVTQAGFAVVGQIFPRAYTFVNTLFTFALGIACVTGLRFIHDSSRDMLVMLRPATSAEGQPPEKIGNFQVPVNLGGITLPSWLGLIFGVLLVIISIATTSMLQPDYGLYGVGMIVLFAVMDRFVPEPEPPVTFDDRFSRIASLLIALLIYNILYVWVSSLRGEGGIAMFQLFSTFAPLFFMLDRPRERRPKPFEKYFFYVFYPLHLIILMVLAELMR